MATTPFAHFRTTTPVICSASPQPNHDPTRHKPSPSSTSKLWWSPLFGWSSDPDYIQPSNSFKQSSGDVSGQPTRSKFGLGCFTEEKAKELRKKTMETSTFHDKMYHSAIASRLASDVFGRQEG